MINQNAESDLKIFEVGPRDGLQNETTFVPTTEKIKLINLLQKSGLKSIEATSFVSPKWVPQMADAVQVLDGIERNKNVSIAALTPNLKGLCAARQARVDEVAIFASASEGFSQKNINCSITQSLQRFEPVLAKAKEHNIPVRGYVSCVIACPYDGDISPAQVAKVVKSLYDMGCYEISLGDTIGIGTQKTIRSVLEVLQDVIPVSRLAGHFHDTNKKALENIAISYQMGIRCFDSSIGGLGGCPYAPGASGNVATEQVVDFFTSMGLDLGINRQKLQEAADFALQLKGVHHSDIA